MADKSLTILLVVLALSCGLLEAQGSVLRNKRQIIFPEEDNLAERFPGRPRQVNIPQGFQNNNFQPSFPNNFQNNQFLPFQPPPNFNQRPQQPIRPQPQQPIRPQPQQPVRPQPQQPIRPQPQQPVRPQPQQPVRPQPQPQTQPQPQQPQIGGQTPAPTASPTAPPTTDSPEYLQCLRNCPSTNEYNPVCGTDSIDYQNEQRLLCAGRCGQNVQLLRRGLCRPRG